MRKHVAVAAVLATLSTMGLARSAWAGNHGVVFVHGTGDETSQSNAANNYWMQFSLDTMRGSHSYYLTPGLGLSTYTAHDMCAWGVLTEQVNAWINANNISDIVVVTHSYGSNPMRYLLAHTTAVTSAQSCGSWSTSGGSTVKNVSTFTSKIRKVIFVAADQAGTPLADAVTTSHSLANVANDVASAFGMGSYNTPSVLDQVQSTLQAEAGSTYAGTRGQTTVGGVPAVAIYGTGVYATITSSDAYCGYDQYNSACNGSCAWYDVVCWGKYSACRAGSYAITAGLKATQVYGWGSTSATTDGFIGMTTNLGTNYNSATFLGTDPYGGDSRLNHNQSRRACHGSGSNISAQISNAISGGFSTRPPDYTISPPAQACNATTQGWQSAYPYSGDNYWFGCTGGGAGLGMNGDSNTDFDCYVAYGYDNGAALPGDFSLTAYANTSYYSNPSIGCNDSWRGDGECDLCLLAKYGYDSVSGAATDDDCVNYGTSTSNQCADLARYDSTGGRSNSAPIGYYSYTATH